VFTGKINHFYDSSRQEDCIQVRQLKEFEKVPRLGSGIQLEVDTLPCAEDSDDDDSSEIVQFDFANYHRFFPTRQVKGSKRDVLLCVQKKHCFSMAKRESDVFYFAVSFPLSIFQGFCIALSDFHEIRQSDGL
jgi:hypothetical protein